MQLSASIFLLVLLALYYNSEEENEDAHLTVPQLINKYGYPVEEHTVITEDGYILTLHRIPHEQNLNKVPKKVVFLMHGVLCSSADWIITGPGKGLGYLMSDEGYDVWMGNARGTTYSRNHTELDADHNKTYWDFSWHEIGTRDLPTMIDYVLNVTGQQQLYHVGHSQGTTTFYVMASTRPEYNNKIKAHFSLAPIAYMNHLTSPIMQIQAHWIGPLESLIGDGEFLPKSEFFKLAGKSLCSDENATQVICKNALFAITGFNEKETDVSLLPVLMAHTPAGSSIRQFLHYGQEIRSGYFRQYDFGDKNWEYYGQSSPPEYDLGVVSTPIYLLYSENDWLSHVIDVDRLSEGLGDSCKKKIIVANGSYNHLDYLYGVNAPEYVYSKVLKIMAEI